MEIKCDKCGKFYPTIKGACPHCSPVPSSSKPKKVQPKPDPELKPKPIPTVKINKKSGLSCRECGSSMKKATRSTGNLIGILGALLVFCIGVFLTTTVVGAIVGVPMMLFALFMGGKRQKVWKCNNCGYFFERA